MKIYIACHSQKFARLLAIRLKRAGHAITSSWLDQPFQSTELFNETTRWHFANENFDDVKRSDVLILVAGPDKYPGGKFVETGFAYGLGKPVIILGRRENMQCYGNHMAQVPTHAELISLLAKFQA